MLFAAHENYSGSKWEVTARAEIRRLIPTVGAPATKRAMALTEYISQEYFGNWINNSKVTLEYDSYQRPTMLVTQSWDAVDEIWYDSIQETAIYGQDGKVSEIVKQWWDGSQWIMDGRVDYSWDGNFLQNVQHWAYYTEEPSLILEQNYFYDSETNRLSNVVNTYSDWDRFFDMRVSFAWDDQGRAQEVVSELLFGEDWMPFTKTLISYLPQDTSNYNTYYNFMIKQVTFGDHDIYHMHSQILLHEEQEFELSEEMEWDIIGKYVYNYDNDSNMINSQYLFYDGMDWVLQEEEDYTYDDHGNPLSWTAAEMQGSELVPWWRQLNTYNELTSIQDDMSPAFPMAIRIYPNPFNPETNIAFELNSPTLLNLSVFNVKGQQVRNLYVGQMLPGNHSIIFDGKDDRGRDLSSGIYFVRMQSSEGAVSRKMILQK